MLRRGESSRRLVVIRREGLTLQVMRGAKKNPAIFCVQRFAKRDHGGGMRKLGGERIPASSPRPHALGTFFYCYQEDAAGGGKAHFAGRVCYE
jgi:hypothetical protein